MTLRFQTHRGASVAGLIPVLADLRIKVFRDWPYLYDGDAAYEQDYLLAYADTPGAVVVTAQSGDAIVGAATGMPLRDHADSFGAALAGRDLDEPDIFYCAESVLLPAFRGQGAGRAFFAARETAARDMGFRWSMFCGVLRPSDHPARPASYQPLDPFWRRLGYRPVDGAMARFSWRDLGDTAETEKPLQVWIKPLDAGAAPRDQA